MCVRGALGLALQDRVWNEVCRTLILLTSARGFGEGKRRRGRDGGTEGRRDGGTEGEE